MDDLISRQAAIDSIEKHLRLGDELYPLTDTDKVLNHAFSIAASCVYNLPSAQPVDKDIDVPVKDCISRQMLLEYIHGEPVGKLLCDKYNLDGLIEQFPSVQPNLQQTCNQLATDCISRQAAIDVASGYCHPANIADELRKLPSAQPERKTGRWINVRGGNIADCDQCRFTGRAWMNYCPVCGADMMEAKNEAD